MLTSGAENLGGKGQVRSLSTKKKKKKKKEVFLPQVHSDLSGFFIILKEVTGLYSDRHFILVLH